MSGINDDLPPGNYVGMPAAIFLEEFGQKVWDVFGEMPYLVGSATHSKNWRDVDVRLILDNEDYKAWKLGDPEAAFMNPKWNALCAAFALLGKSMTGLPIDFQIQQRTLANKQYDNGYRMCLGMGVMNVQKIRKLEIDRDSL